MRLSYTVIFESLSNHDNLLQRYLNLGYGKSFSREHNMKFESAKVVPFFFLIVMLLYCFLEKLNEEKGFYKRVFSSNHLICEKFLYDWKINVFPKSESYELCPRGTQSH